MPGNIPTEGYSRPRGVFCRLHSQRGSALIEIMVSALLVALTATAVFKGIDGATATSARSRANATAAGLAQQDQERMRSMDPRKLASYAPAPAIQTVNRVPYTVTSNAAWVSDRGDSESCTKGSGRVTYVRITSTVTWPQMGNARPVVESSIVSINNAFAKGSLSVKVVDRDGLDLPGVPVSVDPPVNLSSNTNSTGCAVFDGLSAGIYTGHVQKAGYVDPGGTNDVVPPNGWSVSTGSTSVAQYSYDQAGWADFAFDTQIPGPPATTYSIASLNAQPQITLIQPLMPAPGQRVATFAAGASTYTANNLFPFTSPYTAQLGTCPAGMPLNQQTFTAPRGAAANSGSPVVFRLPSVNVTVQRDGVARSAADVKITPPAGCGSARNLLTGADGKPPHVNATDAANVAWPYGNGYTVCVDDNAGGANTRFISQAFNNDVAAGKTFSFNIKTIGAGTTPKGNC